MRTPCSPSAGGFSRGGDAEELIRVVQLRISRVPSSGPAQGIAPVREHSVPGILP